MYKKRRYSNLKWLKYPIKIKNRSSFKEDLQISKNVSLLRNVSYWTFTLQNVSYWTFTLQNVSRLNF